MSHGSFGSAPHPTKEPPANHGRKEQRASTDRATRAPAHSRSTVSLAARAARSRHAGGNKHAGARLPRRARYIIIAGGSGPGSDGPGSDVGGRSLALGRSALAPPARARGWRGGRAGGSKGAMACRPRVTTARTAWRMLSASCMACCACQVILGLAPQAAGRRVEAGDAPAQWSGSPVCQRGAGGALRA